jgi:predicted CoA-substrate-specific enzyme activase
MMQKFLVGLDVGSTTVKAIVVDASTDKTIWQDYQRHETRQPEKVLEFLRRMEAATGISPADTRIFVTGSGGGTIAEMIGAKFVQEVHAVSLAGEKLHPEVYSVIELGGQDAKIIVGQVVSGFIGIDGGSTSTKAALLGKDGEILCKTYQLSNGNPIQETIEMFEKLREQVESKGATIEVLGVGTTGYAKDILKDVLNADVALVETVAHTESALKFYDDPHVIIDVGGQDIKLIVLKDGRVKDFKLNTQCSAGNGYFLQSTAEGFGLKVEDFADIAFSAKSMPSFGYGCAVFMQSDIVNFQRQGWRSEEILAGLADVLPKNVFLYVASIPNLAALGSRFVLQGGTQNNMAVVKAEVDFIKSSFRSNGKEPEIIVHEHCGESGAIGAAQEALRLWSNGKQTTFIGLEAVANIRYRTTRNEDTRCYFCKNNCLRTFIDVDVTGGQRDGRTGDDRAATVEEIAAVAAHLPSLEAIQANLPPVEAHGSSCSTGGSCSSHAPSPFKAKAEPLIQIQLSPGSSKVVELPNGRAAPDHRHLRKGRRRRPQRYERHQGRHR